MKWFTADTHFGHKSIIKHCDRPFQSVEEMDEALIAVWNDRIGKKDEVYHVGDFAWKNHDRYITRLNGRVTLIKGSHDRMNALCRSLFKEITPGLVLKVDNHPIYLHHCCCRKWERGHYGCYHLFGHSHGRCPTYNMSMDVGVDTRPDFSPYSWDEIKELMEHRKNVMEYENRIIRQGKKEIYYNDDTAWLEKKLRGGA